MRNTDPEHHPSQHDGINMYLFLLVRPISINDLFVIVIHLVTFAGTMVGNYVIACYFYLLSHKHLGHTQESTRSTLKETRGRGGKRRD